MEEIGKRIRFKRCNSIAGFFAGLLAAGCIEAAPMDTGTDQKDTVSKMPVYETGYRLSSRQYDGVDLLIVIDNSGSMSEEQKILSSHFLPLINRLIHPIQGDPGWSFPPVENLKVAVVTTDMGLQVGEDGLINQSPVDTPTCENPVGDNGGFMSIGEEVTQITVANDFIECDPFGDQCPENFECIEDGFCDSISESGIVTCDDHESTVFTTTATAKNSAVATQAACLAIQGTSGCGYEQPLEAMVRGLETHPDFIEENHVLAVIVVTDEEDCSIEDPALFSTPEWNDPMLRNIACNANETNSSYLFDPSRYHEKLAALKGGLDEALVFSAIAGVPQDPDCEGSGDELEQAGCLDKDEMQMVVTDFVDPATGTEYKHFAPACERTTDGTSGIAVTQARPGRRFVKTAEDFGANGFVHSICNENWTPALFQIGEAVASTLTHPCFPEKAPWTEQATENCPNCGVVASPCDLFIEYKGTADEMADIKCPDALYADLNDDEKDRYLDKTIIETDIEEKRIYCAIPKIPTPLACDDAVAVEGLSDHTGWYYCENDGNCDYSVDAAPSARDIADGHFFAYRCLADIE